VAALPARAPILLRANDHRKVEESCAIDRRLATRQLKGGSLSIGAEKGL
jgi:hypothetical protein